MVNSLLLNYLLYAIYYSLYFGFHLLLLEPGFQAELEAKLAEAACAGVTGRVPI